MLEFYPYAHFSVILIARVEFWGILVNLYLRVADQIRTPQQDTYDDRFDLLRVVACFLVVLIHIGHPQRPLGTGTDAIASNFWASLGRPSVPLFFMISGAMLLLKDEPLGFFLKKRMIRVLSPLLFWSAFYLW